MSDYDPAFERLWDAYPKRNGRKVKKRPAYTKWQKLSAGEKAALRACVDKHNRNRTWGKYIRDLVTFINQGGWEDEVEEPRKSDVTGRAWEPKPDPFTGSRWDSRANRRMREYLFQIGGVKNPDGSVPGSEDVPPKLQEMIDEKNRIASEYGPAFEEDLQAGADPAEVADEFDGAVFAALDRVCGYNLRHRMMRTRSGK